MTSSSPAYGVRDWWSGLSTVARAGWIFAVVIAVTFGVWLLLPSERDQAIDDCVKRMNQVVTNEPADVSAERNRSFCALMYDLSDK